MADGGAFDMFAAGEPFSAKLLRASSSFDVEPAVLYAALIVGISIEATVIAELLSIPLSFETETVGGEAMADGMKFVISSLPEATVEELEEIIGAVVEATGGDHSILLTDPMSIVSNTLEVEDDEEEEFEDARSEDGEDGRSGEDVDPDDEDEDDEDEDDEGDIDPEGFLETVKAKISGWDDWVPEDPVLRALKVSFADTCVAALGDTPPAEGF